MYNDNNNELVDLRVVKKNLYNTITDYGIVDININEKLEKYDKKFWGNIFTDIARNVQYDDNNYKEWMYDCEDSLERISLAYNEILHDEDTVFFDILEQAKNEHLTEVLYENLESIMEFVLVSEIIGRGIIFINRDKYQGLNYNNFKGYINNEKFDINDFTKYIGKLFEC